MCPGCQSLLGVGCYGQAQYYTAVRQPIIVLKYRCIFLTATISFATVAKVINVFLFLWNLQKKMNVLLVLRIMQKWHAQTIGKWCDGQEWYTGHYPLLSLKRKWTWSHTVRPCCIFHNTYIHIVVDVVVYIVDIVDIVVDIR